MSKLGPGSPFDLFFEENQKSDGDFFSLPSELRAIYGGDWLVPKQGQYRYSNFVVSHDGKASFAIPGHEGGGDISGFNRHDQWIMALTRARADAVIVGANTLRSEPHHIWSAEFIFPDDKEHFAALRERENRRPLPYQVFVTNSGDINPQASVFQDPKLETLIAVPSANASRIRELKIENARIIESGTSNVDLAELHNHLHQHFGINTVLCEGGPKFYGAMIHQRLIDEEFLTISSIMIGSTRDQYRPGLIDGIALEPGNDFGGRFTSVRRGGGMLFVRSQFSR